MPNIMGNDTNTLQGVTVNFGGGKGAPSLIKAQLNSKPERYFGCGTHLYPTVLDYPN